MLPRISWVADPGHLVAVEPPDRPLGCERDEGGRLHRAGGGLYRPRPGGPSSARARCPARAGALQTAHGPVETPAFIPLATKGTVRGLDRPRGGGDRLRADPRQHLPPVRLPGPGADRGGRRPPRVHGLGAGMITDSGGFQVFSLAHGGVADEVKGSGRPGEGTARSSRSTRTGSASAPTVTARSCSSRPRSRWRCRPGSAPTSRGIRRVPALPRRPRVHRPMMERTHRWLGRCLQWHDRNGPERQAVFGIVQGGIHEDLRRESAQAISGRSSTGSRSAARSDATRRRCGACSS